MTGPGMIINQNKLWFSYPLSFSFLKGWSWSLGRLIWHRRSHHWQWRGPRWEERCSRHSTGSKLPFLCNSHLPLHTVSGFKLSAIKMVTTQKWWRFIVLEIGPCETNHSSPRLVSLRRSVWVWPAKNSNVVDASFSTKHRCTAPTINSRFSTSIIFAIFI